MSEKTDAMLNTIFDSRTVIKTVMKKRPGYMMTVRELIEHLKKCPQDAGVSFSVSEPHDGSIEWVQETVTGIRIEITPVADEEPNQEVVLC